MSKILVQIFCFAAIIFLGSNVCIPLFSFYFMSLLLQILKSRISLIVLSVFIKVYKIVHYLHFQLKWGELEEEESTLIGSTLTLNPLPTVEPKAHQLYLHAYPLNTSFNFVTFLLLFYTSLPFTTTLNCSPFCQKIMSSKTAGI